MNTRSRNTLDFSGSGIVQKKTVSVVNYQICFDAFFVRHSGFYIRRPRCNESGNMAKNALILGHSFVKHFQEYVTDNSDVRINPNLNLDINDVRISYKGYGGANIDKIGSCGIPLIRSQRTDIVFLQSASNDLCNQERSVNDRDYVDLIITLRFQLDVQQVVVLQVLHRKPPTPHIRYEVDTVCKFKHACYQCKKNHSVINCSQEQNQPQPTPKQSGEQQASGNPKDKWISSDPIRCQILNDFLNGYDIEKVQFLIDDVTQGFSLNFQGPKQPRTWRNLISAEQHKSAVIDKLNKEVC